MLGINEKLAEIKACMDKAKKLLSEVEEMAIPEQMEAVKEMLNSQHALEERHRRLKWNIFCTLVGIKRSLSIPMVEIGKDKFEFVEMALGYKITSELMRKENREVSIRDDRPMVHEFAPFFLEFLEHVLLHVSKKLDEIPEEVEKEIAKIASWTEPLKKQMAPLEKKIRKAK